MNIFKKVYHKWMNLRGYHWIDQLPNRNGRVYKGWMKVSKKQLPLFKLMQQPGPFIVKVGGVGDVSPDKEGRNIITSFNLKSVDIERRPLKP